MIGGFFARVSGTRDHLKLLIAADGMLPVETG
jgi:hypothetical protein